MLKINFEKFYLIFVVLFTCLLAGGKKSNIEENRAAESDEQPDVAVLLLKHTNCLL